MQGSGSDLRKCHAENSLGGTQKAYKSQLGHSLSQSPAEHKSEQLYDEKMFSVLLFFNSSPPDLFVDSFGSPHFH
jgi:hypothetical protein